MTLDTKTKFVNGSLKWLITIAFAAGGLVLMIKSNNVRITTHDGQISQLEQGASATSAKLDLIHHDVKRLIDRAMKP